AGADIYELLDLKLGECRFVVAILKYITIEQGVTLKVDSKYPNVAKNYFATKGMHVDTIKLNRSVELAPIIDMDDCIVANVETGSKIKENDLQIVDTVEQISTRLVVNKASFATKTEQIRTFLSDLKGVLKS